MEIYSDQPGVQVDTGGRLPPDLSSEKSSSLSCPKSENVSKIIRIRKVNVTILLFNKENCLTKKNTFFYKIEG